jgi:hypothetical protein
VSTVRELGDGAVLLSLHVDALELSCAVEQVPMLCGGRTSDELDFKLSRLKSRARATVPSGPVATGWHWDEGLEAEPVLLLPTALRRAYRYALACSAWVIFVAPPRAVVPRFCVQLRADYLLRVGPLHAYRAARASVERFPLQLVEGKAPDVEPVWRISRLDLAADVAGVELTTSHLDRFTTRARVRGSRHDGDGWDWADAT